MYALGHLSEQTDGSGNPLATFTYEASGRPASVVLGDPSTGSRYYYVYNGHGDIVALTDSSGNVVASYQYDAFGVLTSSNENFPNGWSNPYRYDGADLVRYDSETGLYWMSVRAYDPTLGRFISHDPLGRLAAQGMDYYPYVYTDNNPLDRTDPSGQCWVDESGDTAWNSNGATYVKTPGSRPKVVDHPAVIKPVQLPPCPQNTACSGNHDAKASYLQNLGFSKNPDGGGEGGKTIKGVGLGGLEFIIWVLQQLQTDMQLNHLADLVQPDFFASVANTGLSIVGIPGIGDIPLEGIVAGGSAAAVATLAPVISSTPDTSMTDIESAFGALLTPLISLDKTVTADIAENINPATVAAVNNEVFVLNEVDTYDENYDYIPGTPGDPYSGPTAVDEGPNYSSIASAAWTVSTYSLR